jgi:uncharacterized protein
MSAAEADAAHLTAALVGFVRQLREKGLRTSPDAAGRLRAAVGVLPPGDLVSLYWAGRTCLGVRPDSTQAYDTVFAEYFLGIATRPAGQPDAQRRDTRAVSGDGQRLPTAGMPLDVAAEQGGQDDGPDSAEKAGGAASAAEVLRITPFAACSADELAILVSLTRRLRSRLPQRPSRRWQRGYRREALDLRATARLAMRTQAEVLAPAWRQRRLKPRRLVMLLDVSRSMAPYSRLYLHFGYALASACADAEVVCFGTRLTRITGLLRRRGSAGSLEQAAMSVLDWNGGTRIAEAVAGLRAMPAVSTALRGAVVVIFSDGLELGDPADLGRQMWLLRRTCYRIIWVNPLAGDERYQPLAGGMQAALPYTDQFMPGHTLAALEELADTMSRPRRGRSAAGLPLRRSGHPLGRCLNGLDDEVVPGAAAEIP